jgi:hypothetical protein
MIRSMARPLGWSARELELAAVVARYHRGALPRPRRKIMQRLELPDRRVALELAGVLRLARALRKCGVAGGAGIRAEKSAEAILLRMPGMADDVDSAARLAAGKHLLEEYLQLPVILKHVAKPEKVVALPAQQITELPAASD